MAGQLDHVAPIGLHGEDIDNVVCAVVEAVAIGGDPRAVGRPIAEKTV